MSLPQPDLAVLRKAQRGDERAFAIILRTYETPVFNYVLRLTNGDRALAEDLTQEVFLRVFQGLPRFSLRCKFTTWLFQVTKNRVLDELLDGATDSDRVLIDRMRANDPGVRPSADEVASALGLTENSVSESGTTQTGATQTNLTRVLPAKRKHKPRLATRTKVLATGAAAAIVVAIAIATTSGSGTTRIEPVPHATTPAQQARNLSAWLKTYSR